MRAAIADDAITVTTATRSEAEVREGLGLEGAKPVVPAAAAAAGADAATKPDAAALEQEADSEKPDPEISEAARTLRKGRADARKAKIQTEISEHVARREKAREEADREEARLRDLKKPPAERKPDADAAKPNADGKSAAKKFEFPTWEQWQTDHPDDDYTEYNDARTDARYAFNRDADREVEQAREQERQTTDAFARADQHQKTFIETHPDYEEKLKGLDLKQYGVEVVDGVIVKAPQQFIGLQRLLLRAGEAGPGILYYLADHPDDVARLLDRTTGPADLLETWGEVKYAARAAATVKQPPAAAAAATEEKPAAAAAGPAAKPRTSAPAPLTEVPGGSSVHRTPQQLSEEAGEDADAYIAVRQPNLLKRR